MRNLLIFFVTFLLLPLSASAEIITNRDLYGNISGYMSTNTLPCNADFDVKITFSGKTYNDKKSSGLSNYFIMFNFDIKNKNAKSQKEILPVHFIDRAFVYQSSIAEGPKVSLLDTLHSKTNDGYLNYTKHDGHYKVFVDENSVDVYQETLEHYHPPYISISYDKKFLERRIPMATNQFDKIRSFSDPFLAKAIYDAMLNKTPIAIVVPYSNNPNKDGEYYTEAERATLKNLAFLITADVIQEWKSVAEQTSLLKSK